MGMGHVRRAAAMAVCLVAASGAIATANADPVADFYAGKRIDFVVGGNAGGGYDIYSRLLARYLPHYIPGNPLILVRNMPGAGSIIATRYMYNQATKDGLQIASVFRGAIMEPLLGDADAAKYDPRRFAFLSSANSETSLCLARPDAPVKKFADLFDKELIVSAAGRGTSVNDLAFVLKNVLGVKLKIVTGYKGTLDSLMAVEQNEVQGICGYEWSSLKAQFPDWVPQHKVQLLVQLGMTKLPEIAQYDVPLIWDFVKNEQDKGALELIFGQLTFGRPMIAPPDVPQERVQALRAAFDAVYKDPGFIADAEKAKLDISPTSGEDVQTLVNTLFAASPDQVALARKASE
jgi:tripartite-type tricarboxylate transporter receptor subunit TctC